MSNTDVRAALARWDGIVADVRARFDQVLAEAVAASEPLVQEVQSELTALTQAWSSIEHRMHQHTSEVSDRWNDVSDELSDVEGLTHDDMKRAGDQRDVGVCELEIAYNAAYVGVMARAAEVMRQRALRADAQECECTQCRAPLAKVKPVEQALNVECEYCSAMNTVEPKQALRMFAASGAMFLAQAASLGDWARMRRAETKINAYRNRKDVPMELLEELDQSARGYWTTRLSVEADFVPEQKAYVPNKIATYMKGVEKTLRQHWQWRQRQPS